VHEHRDHLAGVADLGRGPSRRRRWELERLAGGIDIDAVAAEPVADHQVGVPDRARKTVAQRVGSLELAELGHEAAERGAGPARSRQTDGDRDRRHRNDGVVQPLCDVGEALIGAQRRSCGECEHRAERHGLDNQPRWPHPAVPLCLGGSCDHRRRHRDGEPLRVGEVRHGAARVGGRRCASRHG
jgi:hypothetical protein